MKSVVVDTGVYDWEGDVPFDRPLSQTTVYEMHVKGFAQHPNCGASGQARCTCRGAIEKIPYLQDLGAVYPDGRPRSASRCDAGGGYKPRMIDGTSAAPCAEYILGWEFP